MRDAHYPATVERAAPPAAAPASSPTSARRGLLLWHVLAAVIVVGGVAGEVLRPLAPELGALSPPGRWFDARFVARADAYRTPLQLAGIIALCVQVAVACAVAWTPAGRRLVDRVVDRVGARRAARAAMVVAVGVVAATDVILLPLNIWAGFVHEGIWGFRTQGFSGWLRDWAVVVVPQWLAVGVLVGVGWTLARRLPRAWPPVAGIVGTVLAAVVVVASPLVLEPLTFTLTPLPAGPDRTAVEGVLTTAGAPIDEILVADASRRTTKQNAYVSGLGATRRVVLYDTLLAAGTPDEIAMVFAHELGHDQHADLLRSVAFGGAGMVVLAYGLAVLVGLRTARGRQRWPTDPRAAAVVVAVVLLANIASLPLQSVVSRRAEAAADLAALQLTGDPATFTDLQLELADANLSQPVAPAWVRLLWSTHPAPLARLEMGARWPDLVAGR